MTRTIQLLAVCSISKYNVEILELELQALELCSHLPAGTAHTDTVLLCGTC